MKWQNRWISLLIPPYLEVVCEKKLSRVLFSNLRNISMIFSIERPEFRWSGGGLALLFETTAVIWMMPRFLRSTYNWNSKIRHKIHPVRNFGYFIDYFFSHEVDFSRIFYKNLQVWHRIKLMRKSYCCRRRTN